MDKSKTRNLRQLLNSAFAKSDAGSCCPSSRVPDNRSSALVMRTSMGSLDLSHRHFGTPQRSGAMTVLPLLGSDGNGRFSSPLSALKLSGVEGYGKVEMENASGKDGGVAIVPLHIGYIQDRAQNHALCRSALIGAGQKLKFRDACCVQESQGGYLEAADQWFFILPLQLREAALKLRGTENYGKLWQDISQLSTALGLPARGHLEQVICRHRPYLTQYASRFELVPEQTGAVFFSQDKLLGVEIAPSARYFEELWAPLVCFCYGVAAMQMERRNGDIHVEETRPFSAKDLDELKGALFESRLESSRQLMETLQNTATECFELEEEERFLDLRLSTATSGNYAGQIVQEKGRLVYASVFGKRQYLCGA